MFIICGWVISRAPIKKRFVRAGDGKGTTFADNEGARFPPGLQVEEEGEEAKEEEYTVGEVKAGTLVLIHGNILTRARRI